MKKNKLFKVMIDRDNVTCCLIYLKKQEDMLLNKAKNNRFIQEIPVNEESNVAEESPAITVLEKSPEGLKINSELNLINKKKYN